MLMKLNVKPITMLTTPETISWIVRILLYFSDWMCIVGWNKIFDIISLIRDSSNSLLLYYTKEIKRKIREKFMM